MRKYFDLQLKESHKGWHAEWFLIANRKLELPPRTGFGPVSVSEWQNQPTSEGQVQVNELLVRIADLKARGLTPTAIGINFCQSATQPIKH